MDPALVECNIGLARLVKDGKPYIDEYQQI
jgi:hypothetical protein